MRRSSLGAGSGRRRLVALLCGGLLLFAGTGALLEAAPATGSDLGLPARVQRIAEKLRCPVCEGLSAWASDSEAAWEMKQEIAQLVAAGKSDREILDWYVARYGAWILMAPPASGFYLIAWLAPVAALGAGAAWLWIWRRGRLHDVLAERPHRGTASSEFREAVDRRLEEYL